MIFIGTSFFDEENDTWYFLWSSFLISVVYGYVKKFYKSEKKIIEVKIITWILMFLIGHRVFMKLNNKDEYTLSDLSDFLIKDESKIWMTYLVFFGKIFEPEYLNCYFKSSVNTQYFCY